MSFLKELKGWLGGDSQASTRAGGISRENPLFVYIKIPGHIEPVKRGDRFEDPIQAALEAAGLGEITGGGSQLSDQDAEGRRQIEFCGIDVDLYHAEQGLSLLRSELRRLDAPPGTVLLYELNGQEHEQSVHEG